MTAIKTVTMICDVCGTHEHTDKSVTKMARSWVQRTLGWILDQDRDECPACTAARGVVPVLERSL